MSIVLLDESGLPSLLEDEEVFLSLEDVAFYRGTNSEGTGKLFVTSKRIIWLKGIEVGLGWGFREIALHAIARQSEEVKRPSIYCQLAVEGDGEEAVDPQELRFVPATDMVLTQLFEEMSKAAAMCPDEGGPMDCDDDLEIDLETPGVNLMQYADAE